MFHVNVISMNRRAGQHGVAAVEFALLLTLMLLTLSGVFVFWSMLQAQQTVTRATGDGARVLQQLVQGAAAVGGAQNEVQQQKMQQQVDIVVRQGLRGAGLLAPAMVQIQWGNPQVVLQVVYPYELLGSLPSFIALPKSLFATAVVMKPVL